MSEDATLVRESSIKTSFKFNNENKLQEVHWKLDDNSLEAHAWLSEDNERFDYYNLTITGQETMTDPVPLKLEDCIIEAHRFFGLIVSDKSSDNPEDKADFSSFNATNEVVKLVGEAARKGYEAQDPDDLQGHSRETWTKVEEVITGLENR